jgi:hypothetical protein
MAKGDQLRDIQKTGAALDRVKSAENIVEQLAIVGTLLQLNQLIVDVREQLGSFSQEVLKQILHSLKRAHAMGSSVWADGLRSLGLPTARRPVLDW